MASHASLLPLFASCFATPSPRPVVYSLAKPSMQLNGIGFGIIMQSNYVALVEALAMIMRNDFTSEWLSPQL
jgi:hypothetical protein